MLTRTEKQSEAYFWNELTKYVEERGDGTKRAFTLKRDPCKFWQEIHRKGYADGFRPALIAEFVVPLWLHGIKTMDDLLEYCGNNYAEAKANLFPNKESIRFFERHFPRIGNAEKRDVTLNYSGGVSHQLKNLEATVDAIRAAARGLSGGKFEIADFKLLDPNGMEVRENSELSRLTSPWVLSVKSNQIGFSKVPDLKTALKMCGDNTVLQANVPVEQFMTDAVATTIKADPNFAKELEHAWGTIQRLHKVHRNDYCGNETILRSYTSPVVIAAAILSEGITFGEEVKIEGPYGNGSVDHAFKYKDTIVCVTEAKDDDMNHGLRQNIAQLASTRSERKRKFAAMNDDKKFTYYGIATTSHFWQLIELKENVVKSSQCIVGCFDDKIEDKERISGVIAHIVNVLNKCKKNYDDAVSSSED